MAQFSIRPLTQEDQAAGWRLGSIAFGYTDAPMPDNWDQYAKGRISYGVFDPNGSLLAKAVDRQQGQWFGGRVVPTCGIAGVVVLPEARRQGLGRLVLTHVLERARERGAAISTLYPTTPFPYRRIGWEEVGALTSFALPATALAGVRADPQVALRPATEADVPAIHGLYRALAAESSGLMERSGPLFDGNDLLGAFHGVTVAEAHGVVVGYASWQRGAHYDASGKLSVYDLIGADDAATATLLHMVGTWASVAPNIVLRLPERDAAFFHFASSSASIASRQPWMLRLVDASAAVAARGWPPHLEGGADLELADEECPWNEGRFRLVLSGGEGKLEPGGSGTVRLTARGLGAWYAGAATPALLRRAGLLGGGDRHSDAFLLAATAGPTPALLDYF